MSAIYRSISGKVEATMEDGKLFVRDYDPDSGNRGEWEDCETTLVNLQGVQSDCLSTRGRARLSCLLVCVRDVTDSEHRIQPRSEKIAAQITLLQAELEEAIILELADRPRVEVTP